MKTLWKYFERASRNNLTCYGRQQWEICVGMKSVLQIVLPYLSNFMANMFVHLFFFYRWLSFIHCPFGLGLISIRFIFSSTWHFFIFVLFFTNYNCCFPRLFNINSFIPQIFIGCLRYVNLTVYCWRNVTIISLKHIMWLLFS